MYVRNAAAAAERGEDALYEKACTNQEVWLWRKGERPTASEGRQAQSAIVLEFRPFLTTNDDDDDVRK